MYYFLQAWKKEVLQRQVQTWKTGCHLPWVCPAEPTVCCWQTSLPRGRKNIWDGHAAPTQKYLSWGPSYPEDFHLKYNTDGLKVPEIVDCLPQAANLMLLCAQAELSMSVSTLNKTTAQWCLCYHPELPHVFSWRGVWSKGGGCMWKGSLGFKWSFGEGMSSNLQGNAQHFCPCLLYFSPAFRIVSNLLSPL